MKNIPKIYGLLIMVAGLLFGTASMGREAGNVTFTPCKQDAKGYLKSTWVRILLTDSGAECHFQNLTHVCGYSNIRVEVDIEGQDLSIREYAEYESEAVADCYCQLDASFFIEDLKEGVYNLSIYNSKSTSARPYYEGKLNLDEGKEITFIIHKEDEDEDPSGVLSIEFSQKFELKLTPNPATETITLTATGCNLQKVEILDVNGRVLYAATLNGTETFDYNVSQMPSGIYLARVKTPCGILTEKFSVK